MTSTRTRCRETLHYDPPVVEQLALAVAAIALIAFLYSSVGHAGASGYIAVLTILGAAPAEVRPTALLLNILVAVVGTIQFVRAGHFSWRLFWPFAALAVPAAFLGGSLRVPADLLRILLGVILLASAARLVIRKGAEVENVQPPATGVALASGAAIGFLSGMTGTGGGIFLTPLMLFCRWAKTKSVAAVSVVFILVNSIAGIAGYVSTGQPLPSGIGAFAIAALAGGAIGSTLGAGRLPVRAIQLFLALVLVIAGSKLLFS